MGKTVKQLLAETDSQEITDWMAYCQLSPFTAERDDLRSAQICWLLANIHRGKGPSVPIQDFLFDFSGEWAEVKKKLEKVKLEMALITSKNDMVRRGHR